MTPIQSRFDPARRSHLEPAIWQANRSLVCVIGVSASLDRFLSEVGRGNFHAPDDPAGFGIPYTEALRFLSLSRRIISDQTRQCMADAVRASSITYSKRESNRSVRRRYGSTAIPGKTKRAWA